jgi:hypothetical protein
MSGIDWNVELKKIEREFDGLPPAPTQGQLKAKRASEMRAKQQKYAATAALGAGIRVALLALLGVGLYYWPYGHACGFGLFSYMGAEALVAAGGVWVLVHTWEHRMAKAHGLAIAIIFAGFALLASEILPRVGYTRAETAQQWWCGK